MVGYNQCIKGDRFIKIKVIRSLLAFLVAGTVLLGNVNTAHATMAQDEATEWYKQWCEENGVDFEDSRSTGGTHNEKYIGNTKPLGEDSSGKVTSDSNASTSSTDSTVSEPVAAPAPVHEHKYVADLTTDPTCTEEGVLTYTCECGDTYTEPFPALGHQYESEITKEATCIEEGEETFTCSLCGDTYVETIAMTDHVAGKEEIVKEASCTEAGEKAVYCVNCGAELSTEEIPATGHTPGEQELTRKATLFTEGEAVVKCTVCQEVLETIPVPLERSQMILYIVIILIAVVIVAVILGVFLIKRRKIEK